MNVTFKERYFYRKDNKTYGGILYDRYRNSLKNDVNSSHRKIKNQDKKNNPNPPIQEDITFSGGSQTSKSWLNINRGPHGAIKLAHLENSFSQRRMEIMKFKDIQKFWKEWPIFKHYSGYECVSMKCKVYFYVKYCLITG